MIIAVDFDGILCEDKFPEIGSPNYKMISFVRQLMDEGHEAILWTSRAGKRLDEAISWCENRGLHFCAINENAPSNRKHYENEYPHPSPKVYADMYLEDRCPWFIQYHTNMHRAGHKEHEDTIDWLITITQRIIYEARKEDTNDD